MASLDKLIFNFYLCNLIINMIDEADQIIKENIKSIDNNFCDYCVRDIFIHNRFADKFIDHCIELFRVNSDIFFESKKAHMLGTLFAINDSYAARTKNKSPELMDRYNVSIRPNETFQFIIKPIIIQYNERAMYIANRSMIEIIQDTMNCDICGFVACPFHSFHGMFQLNKDNDKNKYCCGWCMDDIYHNNVLNYS